MVRHIVFFDAGGTLLEATPSVGDVYAEVAAQHGVVASPGLINERFKRVWAEKDQAQERLAQKGSVTPVQEKSWWKGIVQKVFDGLGSFENFDAFFDDLFVSFGKESRWRLFPETLEVVQELWKRGHRLAVVSNWDSRLHQILRDHGLTPYFETVVISAEVGHSKPDPEIFRIAMERMGADATEVTHVGDHLTDDIQGALELGIEAIWVDRHGGVAPHGGGVTRIEDLKSLLEEGGKDDRRRLVSEKAGGETASHDLETLVYVSAARSPWTDEALEGLLTHSRVKNARLGITGYLIYAEGNFMQCLEGPREKVRHLYEEIRKDERHHRIIEVFRDNIESRYFELWSMGYARVSATEWSALFKKDGRVNPSPRLLHDFLERGRMLG